MDPGATWYTEVDVDRPGQFTWLAAEPMGTKPKTWLIDADGRRWLLKTMIDTPGRRHRGEDWAEKVAGNLAAAVGIPAATVELARFGGARAVLVLDVRTSPVDVDLVHGNELLAAAHRKYPLEERRGISEYRIDRVMTLLEPFDREPTTRWTAPEQSGAHLAMVLGGLFAVYLAFDAIIGNTDRHHENWAALVPMRGSRERRVLAPSFDHGASLGCGISDAERERRLTSRDRNYVVAAYGRRARSHFADASALLDAALRAVELCPDARSIVHRVASELDSELVSSIVGRMPAARMSQPEREFALALTEANRAELLHRLGDLP